MAHYTQNNPRHRSFAVKPTRKAAFLLATTHQEISSIASTPQQSIDSHIVLAKEWANTALGIEKCDDCACCLSENIPIPATETDIMEHICDWEINLVRAQLSHGQEAANMYLSAIGELEKKQKLLQNASLKISAFTSYPRLLSSALCAITDLYLTDLCDLAQAEPLCVEYSLGAVAADPYNPEAHATLANVRVSQCNLEAARESLKTSIEIWYVDNSTTSVEKAEWPGFATRLLISKLCIEVGMYTECSGVLETCLVEDEDEWEVWYLFAVVYYRMAVVAGKNVGCLMDVDGAEIDLEMENEANIKDEISQEEQVEGLIGDAQECLQKITEIDARFLEETGVGVGQGVMDMAASLIREIEELVKDRGIRD